tara:strand:+ start:701 stop:1147 length:447 start_codon:yes stop_codon:yes gene_type:complete
MSQGDNNKINNLEHAEKQIPYIVKRIKEWDYSAPLCFKLTPYKNPRTTSQNALLHAWCKQMSEHFIAKIPTATPENIKLMMKSRFLGTETIKIGKTEIENQVRKTRDLDIGEMVHFMDNVYHWGIDNGVMLSIPRESEYQKLKTQQVK